MPAPFSFEPVSRLAAGLTLFAGLLAFGPGCAALPGRQVPSSGPGASAMQSLAGRGSAATANDAVKRAILSGPTVPRTIFDVRQRLLDRGGQLATHIVANRGHENPEAGSFSFFESYTGPMDGGTVREGELFIGFFSERRGDLLAVQQSFDPGLMIELIAWDHTKQAYNFWELIGNGKGSDWHYRGDSNDVLTDVATINTGAAGPAFGTRLRCSGCHTLGGPIMKELTGPHNDWWSTEHKLELGSLKLQAGADPQNAVHQAGTLFKGARDAGGLARLVRLGTDRLMTARGRQQGAGQSLKQQLRSLFTPMEMNLASDTRPFRERTGSAVELPAAFFVDTRLAGETPTVAVEAGQYRAALTVVGSRFAPDEANLSESRHAFVVPVRAMVDDRVLDDLVTRGLLDTELIADVLAVDLTTPMYSAARASLIRFVPEQAASVTDLRSKLLAALKLSPADPAARELLLNMTDPARTAAAHRQRAIAFLGACAKRRGIHATVVDWLRLAGQRRAEIDASETSRNPRGKITEPGFRVIFPIDRTTPKPGRLKLNEGTCDCETPGKTRSI